MYHSVYDEKVNLLTCAIRLIFSDWVTFVFCNLYNLIKNSPPVKKCSAPKKAIVKHMKHKMVAKNGCDSRLMAKNHNNDNLGEFGA